MKKTLTVNLGGTVYHIDEDAYSLLDNYLNNLRYHFRKEEGADEIVRDMECRIGELFSEQLRRGQQVITVENVEEVIAQMGKPEDLNSTDTTEEKTHTEHGESYQKAKRRLFRNPDDRILGGVASGLAAYWGWDVTWVRIILLGLGFLMKGLLLVYILAWIIIPLARTATEKLQMRGEPINVDSIGKTVTGGFEKMNEYMHSDQPRSLLHRIGNGIVTVAGFVIKLCLVVLAICCFPALFVGMIVIFALLLAATGILVNVPAILYEVLPEIDWSLMMNATPVALISLLVCGLLVVGIPLAGLLQLIMQSFNLWKPMSTGSKVTLMLVWFTALFIGAIVFFYTCYNVGQFVYL